MTEQLEPVPAPSILSQSVDAYMDGVLDRVPEKKRAIARVEASNAGLVIAGGVRGTIAKKVEASGVGFAERKWGGKGWTYGARGEFKF